MTTAVGSANDALWSQMLRAGWTQQVATDDLSIPGVSSAYMLSEAGARAVTEALAELVSWNSHISEVFNPFDLQSAPEHVRRLCSLVGRLTVRAAAQLAIAKAAKPATDDAQVRQRDCILALDEISKGVLTAGQYIIQALALGPESDAGRDRSERASKALRYAEQCLDGVGGRDAVKQFVPPS